MDKDILARMRELREKSCELGKTIKEDIKPFLHKKDNVTFRRLPWSGSDLNDVSVTTTATCLMALAMTDNFTDFYDKDKSKAVAEAQKAFEMIMKGDEKGRWSSSELPDPNAFTTTLVLRSFGFLKQNKAIEKNPAEYRHDNYHGSTKSLTEIKQNLAEKIDERFEILKYPPTPAIIYWFIDAIERAEMSLDTWDDFYAWTSRTFCKELSRVSAKQEALMDPVAMAMAACLSAKLRNIAKNAKLGTSPKMLVHLPSTLELKNSIGVLFDKQSDCGIWPKYFPLFHYPDAGSNYCFVFEMLEAVLHEFGTELLTGNSENEILEGLEKAVQWCSDNRMVYFEETTSDRYSGWNSGGQLGTLEGGVPESWATAVVHMFLYTLQDVLTRRIKSLLIEEYKAIKYEKSDKKWDDLIDIDLDHKQLDTGATVKKVLKEELIDKIESKGCKISRNEPMKNRLSALLFGPPGTSKTELVKAIAQKLGWPLIMIDPSHFLSKGLERIYSEADIVFEDLLDLSEAVILFDEMDGLVRTRDEKDGNSLDVTSRFLTTSMLPKLAKLHDSGRSLFFMATNYIEDFDPAIKRPGRFDLLLCMWPPSWVRKVESLKAFIEKTTPDDVVEACKAQLGKYTLDKKTEELLNVFTFGETKAFFDHLCGSDSLKDALSNLNDDQFNEKVKRYGEYIILNEKDKSKKDKYKNERERYCAQRPLSCLQ